MSAAMTMTELGDLLRHIHAEHSPFARAGGRAVKYVDPHIDMRDFKCFAITFRGWGSDATFHTQNECRDLPDSLFDRCMAWLDGGEHDGMSVT